MSVNKSSEQQGEVDERGFKNWGRPEFLACQNSSPPQDWDPEPCLGAGSSVVGGVKECGLGGSPGLLQHSACILCNPGACGTANSSGGAGVPAFLSLCQESHAEYTRCWLASAIALEASSGLPGFCCSNTSSSTSLSTGGFVGSTGRGRGSWGSQSLCHCSTLVPFPFIAASGHQGRPTQGGLGPLTEDHPTLDHQKHGFYSLLCWMSFPSFPHSYSRGEISSLTLSYFMALGKLFNACALKMFYLSWYLKAW